MAANKNKPSHVKLMCSIGEHKRALYMIVYGFPCWCVITLIHDCEGIFVARELNNLLGGKEMFMFTFVWSDQQVHGLLRQVLPDCGELLLQFSIWQTLGHHACGEFWRETEGKLSYIRNHLTNLMSILNYILDLKL